MWTLTTYNRQTDDDGHQVRQKLTWPFARWANKKQNVLFKGQNVLDIHRKEKKKEKQAVEF